MTYVHQLNTVWIILETIEIIHSIVSLKMIQQLSLVTFYLIFITHSVVLELCYNENRQINYYRIKSCHKSVSQVIFWKRVTSLKECKSITRERNGLAFNFSPPEAENFTKSYMPNCHVLACPQIGNDSNLVTDLAYDYYSAYGNSNLTQNATCVKYLGLFTLTNNYLNYTQSFLLCQNMSGYLADITSEYRTSMLSQIIRENVVDWYKAVYVGLDDLHTEGFFRTNSGNLLTCSNYRAWAPGHPRSKHPLEDCVTLDSDRLWRVAKCDKVKLKALCELYSHPPSSLVKKPRNVTCDSLDGHKGKRRKCLNEKELFNIYQSSSREDRCALLNFDVNI